MRSQNTILWLHCYVFIGLSLCFLEEEDGLPVIAPAPRETAKNRKCGQEKEQMILQINMQQWEVSIQSVIPSFFLTLSYVGRAQFMCLNC
jgi:hypothetical protein